MALFGSYSLVDHFIDLRYNGHMVKKRYIEDCIEALSFDTNKMAFVSGPRQAGKTTMAKNMLKSRKQGYYYNWDETVFRKQWVKNPASVLSKILYSTHAKPLVILDEIHKAKTWKRSIKGIYDTLVEPCDILVTGSARLNVYRKGSDSLMGRYYHYRLHPFSLAECLGNHQTCSPDEIRLALLNHKPSQKKMLSDLLQQLLVFGPFPEPLLAANKRRLNLWRMGRVEKIIREDLRDLSRLPELSQVEMLVSLLPERVANPVSIKGLSEDLEVAYTTVKRWLTYLHELYYHFEIKPFSKSLPRSIKKSGKLYLWDWSEVGTEGERFENLVACHLLKYCHYLTDTGEGKFELRYIRNKQKKEIDFLLLHDGKPWLPIEVKLNDVEPSSSWHLLMPYLPCNMALQIVKKSGVYKIYQYRSYQLLIISAEQALPYFV